MQNENMGENKIMLHGYRQPYSIHKKIFTIHKIYIKDT